MRRLHLCLLASTVVLFFWWKVTAQNGITISGTASDQTKAGLSGVKLTLKNKASGEARESVSDSAGAFRFENVMPGQYSLKAEAKDYEEVELPITVGAEPITDIKIKMKVQIKDEVTITENRSEQPISPEKNADTVDLDDDLLREMPSDSQKLLPIIANFLSPAAQGTEGLSIVVDGVESDRLNVPTWAIRRVLINKNPYSAQYRRPGKARVEVITQDGSRRHFHGGVALFVRNSALDARNPFAQSKPDLDRRMFEASFSGPLPGNRATFFLSGERLMNDESAVINAQTLNGPFIQNILTPRRDTSLLARMDVRANEVHTLTARYNFNEGSERNRGVGGFRLPEQATSASERAHRFQLSERAIFSAGFLNDLRFMLEKEDQRVGGLATGAAIVVIGAFTGGHSQVFRANRETTLEFQDIATYFRGRHALRFGVEARPRLIRAIDASNFGGTFEFSNLNRLAIGDPFVFFINRGRPDVSFSQHEAYSFLQDEVKFRPNLSLTMGLRYGWQSKIGDGNNFAPRLALAFAPGKQKTIFRAGAGVFYERVTESVTQKALLHNGARIRELVISEPSFTDPLGTGEADLTAPSVVLVAPDISAPYLIQASFSVERELWRRTHICAEYQTLRGVHLLRSRNINAPLPETGLRPDPNFIRINQVESSASMRSNALSFTFRGRIGNLFKGMAQYTLSRTTDDAGGLFTLPANNYDLRPEWGRADFDRRHRFNLVGRLEFPRGFRLGAVLTLASGAPFDITTGFDDNNDTVANDRPPGVARNTGQGPGLAQLDLRFSKLLSLPSPFHRKDRHSENFEFNIDLFNALNRANFVSFIGAQSSPFFGRANAALQARTIQLSLKYSF